MLVEEIPVAADGLDVRFVKKMGDVRLAAGENVVEADQLMTLGEKLVAEMAARQCGPPGDENAHGEFEGWRFDEPPAALACPNRMAAAMGPDAAGLTTIPRGPKLPVPTAIHPYLDLDRSDPLIACPISSTAGIRAIAPIPTKRTNTMNTKVICGVIALAMLPALPARAQDESNDKIANIVFYRAKPGMEQQLNEGLKRHMAWHKDHGGKWTWHTWNTETGERTGGYASGTFGHAWADYDKPDVDPEADGADVAKNILPYVAEGAQWQYYATLSGISRPPEKRPAMNEVITFQLKYGKDDEFMSLIGRIHEAIKRTGWPVNYTWARRVNGGQNPFYVLLLPRENYAAMKGPAKSLPQMLTEAVGAHEAALLLARLGEAVQTETSHLERDRPDLGYFPEAKK